MAKALLIEKISKMQDIRNGSRNLFTSKRASMKLMATIISAMPNQYHGGTTPSIDSPKLVDGVMFTSVVTESMVIVKPNVIKNMIINISDVTVPDRKFAVLLSSELFSRVR